MKILARVQWLKSSSLVYINEKPQDVLYQRNKYSQAKWGKKTSEI